MEMFRVEIPAQSAHGARTPGVLFGCPSPLQAAAWGSLAREDEAGALLPIYAVDVPDDAPVCYSVGENALCEIAFYNACRGVDAGVVCACCHARWGAAQDVPADAYEVRVEAGARRFPARLVGYRILEQDRVLVLLEDNSLWVIVDWNARRDPFEVKRLA